MSNISFNCFEDGVKFGFFSPISVRETLYSLEGVGVGRPGGRQANLSFD